LRLQAGEKNSLTRELYRTHIVEENFLQRNYGKQKILENNMVKKAFKTKLPRWKPFGGFYSFPQTSYGSLWRREEYRNV
jgi:hypothetical protein